MSTFYSLQKGIGIKYRQTGLLAFWYTVQDHNLQNDIIKQKQNMDTNIHFCFKVALRLVNIILESIIKVSFICHFDTDTIRNFWNNIQP